MNVGLIIYGSLETRSGGYLYDRMLVEALRQQGDRVEIISLPWRGYSAHLEDNFSPALLKRLRQLSCDILIQDELNHPSLFWLNRRLRPRVTYPIVSIVHHLRSSEARPAWQNAFYRQVERLYLSSLDGFIFNSQTTRQVVQTVAGWRATDSRQAAEPPGLVAYPGGDRLQPDLNAARIARRAQRPGPLRLLFVGNLIPRKGLHTLLEAAACLPSGRWQLHIVGDQTSDPTYTRQILQQVAHLGLDHSVFFEGPLDDRGLHQRMSANHLLVVPSSYEGFGIVYLEGMGFGLPAIGTTGGAAGEIIRPGQNGFLIAPEDAVALAGYLLQLIQDRDCLNAMAQAAYQHYQTQPTWQATTRSIRSFLLTFPRASRPPALPVEGLSTPESPSF